MKSLMKTAAALIALATPAVADPVTGSWALYFDDPADTVQVRVYVCGSKICGDYERLPDGIAGAGSRMFWDMQPNGGGRYSGGKILTLDNGKTYTGKLALSGSSLQISGCLLGGAVCRGESFQRVN